MQAKTDSIAKLSAKLDVPTLALKTYWTIVSRFLNKKKISTIRPVLVNGKLISHFREKFDHINFYFATQCPSKLSKLKYETKDRLNSYGTIYLKEWSDYVGKLQ